MTASSTAPANQRSCWRSMIDPRRYRTRTAATPSIETARIPRPASGSARPATAEGIASIPNGFLEAVPAISPGARIRMPVLPRMHAVTSPTGHRQRRDGSLSVREDEGEDGQDQRIPDGDARRAEQEHGIRKWIERIVQDEASPDDVAERDGRERQPAGEQHGPDPAAARARGEEQPDGRIRHGHGHDGADGDVAQARGRSRRPWPRPPRAQQGTRPRSGSRASRCRWLP